MGYCELEIAVPDGEKILHTVHFNTTVPRQGAPIPAFLSGNSRVPPTLLHSRSTIRTCSAKLGLPKLWESLMKFPVLTPPCRILELRALWDRPMLRTGITSIEGKARSKAPPSPNYASAPKKYLVQRFSKKLRNRREILQLQYFSLQLSIPRKKWETIFVGKIYVLHFLSATCVRETQPDQATVVAHSPGWLSVSLVCAANMAPTNANVFC